MKKIIIITLGVLLFASCNTVKKVTTTTTDSIKQYRYDLEYVKNAGDGMSLVKVWSYDRKERVALERCKASAVHGVIFKGYSGQGAAQPALVRGANAYDEHKEYFDQLFQSGNYMKYITNEVAGSTEKVKLKGGEVKVSQTVTVNVKALRRDLEQAGIARGLSTGF